MTVRNVTEKSSVIPSGFYHTFLYNYIYIGAWGGVVVKALRY